VAEEKPDHSTHLLARASVFAQYQQSLHRYVVRCIRDDTDVKDMMQEIAIGYLKVPRDTLIEDPAKYLFTIALNVMNAYFRRKGRNPVTYDTEATDRLLEMPENPDMCEAESGAIQQDLLHLIQQLPRAHYDVLRLRVEDGLSYSEIAAQLGLSEDTVKKYLYTAKAALRRGGS
jgi:RNA polymerase sigma factor (sigma-70 family)